MRKVEIEKYSIRDSALDLLIYCPVKGGTEYCSILCAWYHEESWNDPADTEHQNLLGVMCGDKIIGERDEL